MAKRHAILLSAALLCYAAGRISQLFANRLPVILIVLLHVLPPAAFACVHGAILYRSKGILVFFGCCCGTATIFESLSLRTGFPFGDYYFTDLMGPKLFQLPVLLVLAYFGIGYASWILALLILDYRNKALAGVRLLALPLLAALIMTAWDLSMEADWATLDHAWIWKTGGAFFGVPIGNFFGWYLTTFTQYLLFAFYLRPQAAAGKSLPDAFWTLALGLYSICAAGNLLLPLLPMTPLTVADAAGHLWLSKNILAVVVLMSGIVMLPLTALAWLRLKESTYPASSPSR